MFVYGWLWSGFIILVSIFMKIGFFFVVHSCPWFLIYVLIKFDICIGNEWERFFFLIKGSKNVLKGHLFRWWLERTAAVMRWSLSAMRILLQFAAINLYRIFSRCSNMLKSCTSCNTVLYNRHKKMLNTRDNWFHTILCHNSLVNHGMSSNLFKLSLKLF